jgi:peptidylprolyl isomerase
VVIVSDISDAEVTLDANHPLAGKDLILDVRLIDIV